MFFYSRLWGFISNSRFNNLLWGLILCIRFYTIFYSNRLPIFYLL
nr:MAG TPA: hypothetical protein [Bacteriophage sp.]